MRLPCQQAGLPQSSMWDFSSIVSGCGCRSSDARRCWKCLSRILFFFLLLLFFLSSFFLPFSFPLFFFFFNLFCFRQFLWFSSLFSFSFPFFPFLLFFFSFYLSIYPSIHPPDNGQFSVPQKRRIRERSNNIYSPPSFEETYEIFPSAASSACLLSLRNDTLSPFFFNIFLFFLIDRSSRSRISFKIQNRVQIFSNFKFFQNFSQRKKKKRIMVEERSRGFIYLFFFSFPSFSTNSRNFLQNPRRSSRERVQTWTKTGGIQETRSLSPNNPTFIIRDCLSDYYYYYRCVSLTSFLYLSIFFLSRVSRYFRFFFFSSLGSTILECSVFVWGSKTAARGW